LAETKRTARRLLTSLVAKSLVASEAPGSPLRLGFPARLLGCYFPRLYPEGEELAAENIRWLQD
jgi:hypothetical protein